MPRGMKQIGNKPTAKLFNRLNGSLKGINRLEYLTGLDLQSSDLGAEEAKADHRVRILSSKYNYITSLYNHNTVISLTWRRA